MIQIYYTTKINARVSNVDVKLIFDVVDTKLNENTQ